MKDTNGEPIPGSTILLEKGKGTVTNPTSYYQFDNFTPGTYTLSASCVGYVTQTHLIEIRAGKHLTLDFRLREIATGISEAVVTGANAEAKQLRLSGKAVDVIDTRTAKLKSGDMAEMIAQAKGVNIRRSEGSKYTFCQTIYSNLNVQWIAGGRDLHRKKPDIGPVGSRGWDTLYTD